MFAVLALAGSPARAQQPVDPAPAWQVHSFREDAGVEEKNVHFVDFEEDGTGWFAVSDGLYRYDGYTWTRFTTADGLPSDYVRCVLVAGDGRLWVGTDLGAGVFDEGGFDPAGTTGMLAGPSVRRIVEDRDGALWFCSDRWPNAEVDAGLTRLQDGEWRSWGEADGLPSDYVSDVFEAADGRRFVLTDSGLARFDGDGFALPLAQVVEGEGEDYVWSMVESERHGLLVSTTTSFFHERDGTWRRIPNEVRGLYLPKLCATSDGDILACHSGPTARFVRFDGEGFVPATEAVPNAGLGVEVLAEDPRGGVWVAGFDRILRWDRSRPRWQAFADLGTPRFVDVDGGAWFVRDDGRPLRRDELGVEEFDGTEPLHRGAGGPVWFHSPSGLSRWSSGSLSHHSLAGTGLDGTRLVCVDAGGAAWVAGRAPGGELALARLDGEPWSRVTLAGSDVGDEFGLSRPDPSGGVWQLLHHGDGSPHRLFHIRSGEAREVELPDRVQMASSPRFAVDDDGRVWLHGFFGLLRMDREDGWWREIELPIPAVTEVAPLGEEVWLACRGHLGGGGALIRLRGEEMEVFADRRGGFVGGDDHRLLFASGSDLHLITAGLEGPPVILESPTSEPVDSGSLEEDGVVWLRSGAQTLRRALSEHPPRAWIQHADDLLQARESLELEVALRDHGVPGTHRSGVVSWRLDGREWSPWSLLSKPISVGAHEAGTHQLELRLRDASGHSEQRADVFAFRVLPVPLQHRLWFFPALGALLLALALLAGFAVLARARLARQARALEQAVDQRTVQLRASERRYRALFEDSGDAVLLFELDGTLMTGNRAATELLGAEGESLPATLAEVFGSDVEFERLRERVTGARGLHGARQRVRTLGGSTLDVLMSSNHWHDEESGQECLQLILHDVTEQERLEERLRQTQKMEAIGRMAGGIAHDLNNILTVVFGYGDLVRMRLSGSPEALHEVEAILDAAGRARALTEEIQVFSRSQVGETKPIETSVHLREVGRFLPQILGPEVELVLDLPDELAHVRLEPRQLERLLVNLAKNASQAMAGVGKLTVHAREVSSSDPGLPEDMAAPCVLLEVADTGPGMDPQTRSRAFEPFFTTKPIGQGTGLGLAIVYGIVQQASGKLELDSAPGEGARFRIWLPGAEALPVEVLEVGPSAPVQGGGEAVLLVEDEDSIREFTSRLLAAHGYRVTPVASAREALALFEDSEARFDLVLSDIVMPGMSGTAMVRRMLEREPGLPVILMSGYPRPDPPDPALAELHVPYVAKPFLPSALLARVREALAGLAGRAPAGRS